MLSKCELLPSNCSFTGKEFKATKKQRGRSYSGHSEGDDFKFIKSFIHLQIH